MMVILRLDCSQWLEYEYQGSTSFSLFNIGMPFSLTASTTSNIPGYFQACFPIQSFAMAMALNALNVHVAGVSDKTMTGHNVARH